MELVNTNDGNSFDPTPSLKSSPIPIEFISFNWEDENCVCCGEKYIKTLCFGQKYCKTCLLRYINNITDNNAYLDVYFLESSKCRDREISRTVVPQNIGLDVYFLEGSKRRDHEISRTVVPQNIHKNCEIIVWFKQIGVHNDDCVPDWIQKKGYPRYIELIKSKKDCKLCGKSLYQGTDIRIMKELKLCSDCYLISFELIESSLIKKKILILYLPWWHNYFKCNICDSKLTFTSNRSNRQKYCTNCYIFYVGCRYCLTTNIIFGPTLKSQCKKCKRISSVNSDFDEFLFKNNLIYNNLDYLKLADLENIVKNIDEYFAPRHILSSIKGKNNVKPIKWIPYFQIKDAKVMTKGGYGIIYKATWYSETVILKRFENSKNDRKYFLNELKSNQHCYNQSLYNHIIKIYGCTKHPELGDYILVMKYASEGDLYKHLQKNFTNITWNSKKLSILWQISHGLEHIHNNKFIHRDFHSGNILFDLYSGKIKNNEIYQWKIGDLGLSQPVNNTPSNNEIYGVIPYVAPEIFNGSSFSKESDIYSFGMIMWELTTGCKPFYNVKHDIHLVYKILDGKRPKITEDTPECYANLMKSCWDPDPKKRPSIKDIRLTFSSWAFKGRDKTKFGQAETKRKKLIELKKIGPEFAEKCHPEAIYTSRPLSALISECSTTISSTISFGNKQDCNYTYKSKEPDFDIDIDIDIERLLSQNLSQNSSTSTKRSIEELNLETHDNNGKRIKSKLN